MTLPLSRIFAHRSRSASPSLSFSLEPFGQRGSGEAIALQLPQPAWAAGAVASEAQGELRPFATPWVKRRLVKSLKRGLQEPVQLGDALVTIRSLERLDPALVVQLLAPRLMGLPPMLQLEALALMTRLGREALNPALAPGHTLLSRLGRRPYDPQRYLHSVEALMTPIAPPAVFAAALRYSLYLGPAISPKALQLHLQPKRSPAVRAVAAAFALNPIFGSAQEGETDRWRFSAMGHCHPSDRLTQGQWRELMPQAQEILRAMLTHGAQEERWAASEVLMELADLTPFKAQIPPLLEDFAPQVREAVIGAIAQTRSRAFYPYLLKALRSPLVEQPAHAALVLLGNEVVPLLQRCTQHPDLTLKTKERSWRILMEIATPQARTALVEDVLYQQGEARASLLNLLVTHSHSHTPRSMAARVSYGAALSQLLAGETGVMQLVREELWLLSQLYAALVELHPQRLPGRAARQLRQAIQRQQRGGGERILLLLQMRYPAVRWDQLKQQLRHRGTLPQGLKRLGKLLEPPLREPVLAVFDARPVQSKRAALANWDGGDVHLSLGSHCCEVPDCLRRLIDLGPGLEPPALASAYALALEQEVALPDAALLQGLNHGNSEVRAAAQTYLHRMPAGVVTALLEVP